MGSGKKKIEIKKIEKESSRMVTFSTRRKGLFKKCQELQCKAGARVAIIVFSPAGNPHTFGDVSLLDATLGHDSAAANEFEFKQGADTFEASTSYNADLKQWLESINVEGCDEIEQLRQMKEQLQAAKERIHSVDLVKTF